MMLAHREHDRRAWLHHARVLVRVGRKRAHGLGVRRRQAECRHRGDDANRLGGGALGLAHFDLLGVGLRYVAMCSALLHCACSQCDPSFVRLRLFLRRS